MSFARDQSACCSPRKKMNLFFVGSLLIVTVTNACEYDLLHSNGSVHRCLSDQCDQFVDPSSLKIVDRLCRTSFLSLSFSTYGHVRLFLVELSYPLSMLFLRQSSVLRVFRLFVHRLNDADQPLAYEEVIRLGTQIDLYQLCILHLPRSFSHRHSVDLLPEYPQWFLVQMKMFECRSWAAFDRYPCSTRILPPQRKVSLEDPSNDTRVDDRDRHGDLTWLWISLPLAIALSVLLSLLVFFRRKGSSLSREESSTEATRPEEESNYGKFSLHGQLQYIPNSFSSSTSLRF